MTTTQDRRRSFQQAIAANPNDPAPRLVYADWLTEQGQGEQASLQRWIAAVLQGKRRFELTFTRLGLVDQASYAAQRLQRTRHGWQEKADAVFRRQPEVQLVVVSAAPNFYCRLRQQSGSHAAREGRSPIFYYQRGHGVAYPVRPWPLTRRQYQQVVEWELRRGRLADYSFFWCRDGQVELYGPESRFVGPADRLLVALATYFPDARPLTRVMAAHGIRDASGERNETGRRLLEESGTGRQNRLASHELTNEFLDADVEDEASYEFLRGQVGLVGRGGDAPEDRATW